MLIIKNTVKDKNGNILSEMELLKKDFEEIVLHCPIPEDEDVELHRTITIYDDGKECVKEEKKIFNKALENYEKPYIEGSVNYDIFRSENN